jgi:hypothetical protein
VSAFPARSAKLTSIGQHLLLVCILGWGASLLLPAIEVQGGPGLSGFEVLRRGWTAGNNAVFAWYANPLFLAAVLCHCKRWSSAAFVLAAIAFVLGISSFWATEQARLAGTAAVPPFSFRAGFYVWLGALAGLLALAGHAFRRRKTALRG